MVKGLENIIATESSISSIIGSTLTYRGISIEELANKATFEEVVYLLWYGKLPNAFEYQTFVANLEKHMVLTEAELQFLSQLPKDAHPMRLLQIGASFLGLINFEDRNEHAVFLQAKIAMLVTWIHYHKKGESLPEVILFGDFVKTLTTLWFGRTPTNLELEIFNKVLILHAEHELNASTFSARVTVATLSDLVSGLVSAIGTLKGPLHGGANEEVMKTLLEIGSLENVDAYITEKLERKEKVMGIGHRVYKDGDPRAWILKDLSKRYAAEKGVSVYYEMSEKIENIIWEQKALKPNVDFYSASLYYALGIEPSLFTPIFALSRTSGWIGHMLEQLANNRLIRPRAAYTGPEHASYIPIQERK